MGFINALPSETTLRLWDLLLLHGAATLFAAALATLRAVADPLAKVNDFEQCYTLLKQARCMRGACAVCGRCVGGVCA